MKAASAFRILLTAVALVACRGEQHPAATPMQALQRALDHLAMGDADTYFASLDFGDGADSATCQLLKLAVVRKMQDDEASGTRAVISRVTDGTMHSDTTATVFYVQQLANGDTLHGAQKMVCTDGGWKLRMRN